MSVFNVDAGRFTAAAPATENAEKQRVAVARKNVLNTRPPQPDNGDSAHATKRGTFTKGLKHDPATGLVDPAAFTAFSTALASNRDAVFAAVDAIPVAHLGAGAATRKWVNPVAGRSFSVVGGDPSNTSCQRRQPSAVPS